MIFPRASTTNLISSKYSMRRKKGLEWKTFRQKIFCFKLYVEEEFKEKVHRSMEWKKSLWANLLALVIRCKLARWSWGKILSLLRTRIKFTLEELLEQSWKPLKAFHTWGKTRIFQTNQVMVDDIFCSKRFTTLKSFKNVHASAQSIFAFKVVSLPWTRNLNSTTVM